MSWNAPSWTESQGRPVKANLKTLRCSYTKQQYKDLEDVYLHGADSSWKNFFTEGGSPKKYTVKPHYYRTSIKWCNSLLTGGANGAFKFSADPGSSSFSNCQDEYYKGNTSATQFIYPYYYSPLGEYTGKTDNQTFPAFDLVVLDFENEKVNGQSSIDHPYYDESTGTIKQKTRLAKDELINYANWAAYYRNRVAATKTVASHAFVDIPDDGTTVIPRVAFNTINRTSFTPEPFTGTARKTFTENMFAFLADSGTPLRMALHSIGSSFDSNTGGKNIVHSCQRNYNIMFTDGLWNETISGIGDVDGATLASGGLPDPDVEGAAVYGGGVLPAQGQLWPHPIRDIYHASNTLSDIALYYWKKPLGGSTFSSARNVLTTNRDPATWPHLNFYGMGFGVKGTLPSLDKEATLQRIKAGDLSWPQPQANQLSAVDDLWHASVNGFGRYVSENSPAAFKAGLRSILTEILNLGGSRSASGYTSRNLLGNSEEVYSVSFSPGWNGDVIRNSVSKSGVVGGQVGPSATENLSTQLTPTASDPEPWRTKRYVFTRTAGEHATAGVNNAVPFRFDKLTPTQLGHLGTTPQAQKNMIAYLRGDRSREGDSLGRFRVRGKGPLGDIVDAQPVVVKYPSCTETDGSLSCVYDEALNPGYEAFYNNRKSRSTMIYVASNDGMLHAFDRNLEELWAYIPMDIIRDPAQGGIANLSYQEADADKPFTHYHYVNATPRAWDVKMSGGWKTLLVGGLGKGGTSYYALDVTHSDQVDNEDVSAPVKSLWEFTDDNMGYTYGRATLAKTNGFGGKWVAILPSGYSNGEGNGQPKKGDGKGRIFFVDLDTGKKLHEIATPDGSKDDPVELVHIGGYVKGASDQLVMAIYAGDQKGNLWRVDMEGSEASWKFEKLAVLKDRFGNPQRVTTTVWPQFDQKGNRWILVGTGGFLSNDDLTSTVRNTFYAFRDGDFDHVAPIDSPKSRGDLFEITDENGAPDLSDVENGWFQDMDDGYHVNIAPQVAYYTVAYAVNKYIGNAAGGNMAGDLCDSAAFEGRVYARDIASGEAAFGRSSVGGSSSNGGSGSGSGGGGLTEYITTPRGVAGFSFVVVSGGGGSGSGSGRPQLTVMVDDTDGNKERGDPGLGEIEETTTDVSTPARFNIRYIDN